MALKFLGLDDSGHHSPMAKKQRHNVGYADILFVPSAVLLSYFLGQWLPLAPAAVLSLIVVSAILYLLGPTGGSFKRFLLELLIGAALTFSLIAFFGWPP
jgi:hypothetical protein